MLPLVVSELSAYGLSQASFELIREKDGVIVARVRDGGSSFVLKAFEDGVSARETENYRILASLGVPILRLYGSTARSVLTEDLASSPDFRLGTEDDLRDPAAVAALARWYRTLHSRGAGYVRRKGEGMYDEWDLFTHGNLVMLGERLGISEHPSFLSLLSRFGELKTAVDRAPRTLCYNDFHYTNMAVARDKSSALMFDYNYLGKGCTANDLLNVAYWLTDEHADLFLREYGGADAELIALQRTVSPVVTLVSALNRGVFPYWAKEALGELLGD